MRELDLTQFEKRLARRMKKTYDASYKVKTQVEQGTLHGDTLSRSVEMLAEQLEGIRADVHALYNKFDRNLDLEETALHLLIDSLRKDSEVKKKLTEK